MDLANLGDLIGISKKGGIPVYKKVSSEGMRELTSVTKDGKLFKTVISHKYTSDNFPAIHTEFTNHITGETGIIDKKISKWSKGIFEKLFCYTCKKGDEASKLEMVKYINSSIGNSESIVTQIFYRNGKAEWHDSYSDFLGDVYVAENGKVVLDCTENAFNRNEFGSLKWEKYHEIFSKLKRKLEHFK